MTNTKKPQEGAFLVLTFTLFCGINNTSTGLSKGRGPLKQK